MEIGQHGALKILKSRPRREEGGTRARTNTVKFDFHRTLTLREGENPLLLLPPPPRYVVITSHHATTA